MVFKSFYSSSQKCYDRVCNLSGKKDMCKLVIADIRDTPAMDKLFNECGPFDAVIHFAAYKSVGESVAKPLMYYENNISGTLNLLEVMQKHGCKNIIFSSSATVYGISKSPLSETSGVGDGITNPYGWTKFMMEQILTDLQTANPDMGVVLLRYFNPVGAHPSGDIGESPNGIPNNLMPYVQQVAIGIRPHVNVFGNDYDTPDGTGVRDYIHVMDLADGHLAALKWLFDHGGKVREVFNLGTGTGYSVLDMIKGMEKACGHEVKYVIAPRRPGDLATCYCDPTKAKNELNWTAKYGIDEMCRDSWNWQKKNPKGFEE